jgi:hypothetical protein
VHRISELAVRLGPLTTNFDAGNGVRVFQWKRFDIDQTPGMATNIDTTAIYLPPQVSQTECRLSVAAPSGGNTRPDELGQWIVRGWRYSGNGCV